MKRNFLVAALAVVMSAGCVSFPEAPAPIATPRLEQGAIVSVDGARLGATQWRAATPRAIIIGVHGMNDYAGAFSYAGPYFSERGVSLYAYDQRGFGRSPNFGRWAGADAMRQDLRAAIASARAAHPKAPIFALGHSMGAAVVLSAMREAPLDVDGVILAAPGIWGGAAMPLFYRGSLNIAASFAPGKQLTGERAARQASDNIDFLRAMYQDPHVVKETRLDAVLGAVRIMGEAWDASDEVSGDILLLIGERDEIIPVKKQRKASRRLAGDVDVRAYPDGWHLLLADQGRNRVFDDILFWVEARDKMRKRQASVVETRPAVSEPMASGGDGESSDRRP